VTYNASSRKDIRRVEKSAKLAEDNRIAFIKAAMDTLQGRTFFYDLLSFCHLFSDPFTGDALREAYSKGERNVGLRLFADVIAHCPQSYITMMSEAQIQEILNDRRNLDDDDSDPGDDDLSDTTGELR
jgi:hypothetical protein